MHQLVADPRGVEPAPPAGHAGFDEERGQGIDITIAGHAQADLVTDQLHATHGGALPEGDDVSGVGSGVGGCASRHRLRCYRSHRLRNCRRRGLAVGALLELALCLTEGLGQLRELGPPEQDEDDDEKDE